MPRPLPSLAIATLVVVSAACSYDWTTTPVTDGGHDASTTDATPTGDATTGDASASDAIGDTSSADTAPVDSGPPTCATLLANVASERGMAKTCTLPDTMVCTTTTTDECGCPLVIDQRKTAYDNAVAAYAAAQCPRPGYCSTCGTAITMRCIVFDGGPGLACSQ